MQHTMSTKGAAILALAVLLLTACGPSAADLTPTVDVSAIRTEAVSTFSIALTETALTVPTSTPTPTLSPSPTPTATTTGTGGASAPSNPSCYGLLYDADVTIPDNTTMTPGQKFTKTWRAQNTGSCAWAPGFTFGLIGGDAMGGQRYTLTQPVSVGAKTELSIEMTAPLGKTGTVQGTWQMADASGRYFGNALTVVIEVGGATPATATVPATASPTPTPTP
jgi:hypothetical protein